MTPEFRKPRTAPEAPPVAPVEAGPPPLVPAQEPASDAPPEAPLETDYDGTSASAPERVVDAPTEPVPGGSRFGAVWVSSILAALVLILLLVFIIQNSTRVDISFLGAHGRLPLGVALLLSAVSGLLLVAIPGTGRIRQLRRQLRRGGGRPAGR